VRWRLFVLLLAARVSTRQTLPLGLAIAPLAIVYAIAEFRMVYRPETTLFLFLALEILVFERWLMDHRRWLRGGEGRVALIAAVHTPTETSRTPRLACRRTDCTAPAACCSPRSWSAWRRAPPRAARRRP
jgi:hypothetical protein